MARAERLNVYKFRTILFVALQAPTPIRAVNVRASHYFPMVISNSNHNTLRYLLYIETLIMRDFPYATFWSFCHSALVIG